MRKETSRDEWRATAQETPLHYICLLEMISENSAGSETGHEHACTHENISRLNLLIKTMQKCRHFFPFVTSQYEIVDFFFFFSS